MHKQKYCYDCGKPLAKGENHREHIPAQNLYEGYGEEFKRNRITVPSCHTCNNSKSETDKEFRNLIGIISQANKNREITDKAVGSILRKPNQNLRRLHVDNEGHVRGVEFKVKTNIDYHTKNFKGVFYHQYGFPLPSKYKVIVHVKENDWSDTTMSVIKYLTSNFEWKYSGHPDIFKYILQPYWETYEFDGGNIPLKGNESTFICIMSYNETHGALVFATTDQI